MPDITISLTTEQGQRFLAACTARLLGEYIEATGDDNPDPDVLATWCLKRLGGKFTLHYERRVHEASYDEEPFS